MNIQAGLVKLPIYTTIGATAGLVQQFNRFDFSLKGTFDRSVYQNSVLTDGESSSNDFPAFDQYGGSLSAGYEIEPGFQPFVELAADSRVHDSPVDIFGENRDSIGASGKVGGAVAIASWLTGEMAAGHLQRDYKNPSLPTIAGVTHDGTLLWQATAKTSAKFTATSVVNESILQGVSGAFSRDVSVQVDHAFSALADRQRAIGLRPR